MSVFVDLVLKAKNLLSRPIIEAKEDTQDFKTELESLNFVLKENDKAQALIAKNLDLETRLESTGEAAKEARRQLDALAAEYQQTAGPAKTLADAVKNANNEVNSSQKGYDKLSNELKDISATLNAAGVAQRNLSKEQSNLSSSSTVLAGKIKATDVALKNLAKGKTLEAQLKKDNAALSTAKKHFDSLTASVAAAEKPNVALNKALKSQTAQVKSAQTAYDKTSGKIDGYKTSLQALGIEVNSIKDAEAALKASRSKSLTDLNALQIETKKLTDLQAQQARSTKLTAQAEKLNTLLTKQKNTLKELEVQYKQTAKPSRELEQSYAEAQTALGGFLRQQDKLKLDLAANNKALDRAGISTKNLAEKEKKLALESANLTRKINAEKAAIKANDAAKTNSAANTDLLTHATRRLAQMYTTLIAAQKAIQAVSSSVNNYGDLESAITRVEKTTGDARKEVAGLASELQEMSADVTPAATNELLRYAEVAGQLGAKGADDIMNLVTAADALAVSTDLAGDEAVTLLTRILSMTGEGTKEIHNLSSTVVELGNNFAVSESEIVSMTKEMVTGTTSIKLGSAAAAAWGTVLKESGQQAERSRSAMFEMSQVIKKASVEGGADLQKLIEVTGMTADAIEKNLKDKPEAVLLAFAQGLNKIKTEGGLVSSTLQEFGINGKEAISVIEIASDKTIRLEQAMIMAAKANKDGTAHIKEAAKAYADQNSELSRLTNKFIQLQTVAGEAMGDELQGGIEVVNQLLSDTQNTVGELVNTLADLGESVVDVFSTMSVLVGNTGLTGEVGALHSAILLVDNALQGIAFSASLMSQTVDEGILANISHYGLAAGAAKSLSDAIKHGNDGMNESSAKVARNVAIWNGETSATYEDLKEVAGQYKDVISELSKEEQKQLQELLKANTYNAEKNRLYSEFTQKIIRQNRILEQTGFLQEQQLKRDALKLKQDKEIAAQQEKSASDLALLLDRVGQSTTALADEQSALAAQYEFNLITEEQYKQGVELLNKAQGEQIKQGQALRKENEDQVRIGLQSIQINAKMSDEIQSLVTSINKEYKTLNDLKVSLVGVSAEKEKYKTVTQEIEVIEERIANKQRDMIVVQDLAGKKIYELTEIKRQHDLVLKNIHLEYERGIITFGEYQEKLDAEKTKTELLSSAIDENSIATEKNAQTKVDAAKKIIAAERDQYINRGAISKSIVNDALRERDAIEKSANAKSELTAAEQRYEHTARETTEAVGLMSNGFTASADQADLTALSISGLRDKLKELEYRIATNRQVYSAWWSDIARQQIVLDQNSLAVANQTKKLREWEEQLINTQNPSVELINNAENATRAMYRLDDATLSGLNSAIDSARAKMQSLRDSAADALATVQDELDRANDNLEAVEKRSAEAKLKELNAQLSDAKAINDKKAMEDLNKAIALTKELNKSKMEQLLIEKAQRLENQKVAKTPAATPQAETVGETPATTTSSKTITFRLESASRNVELQGYERDQDDLLAILKESGLTSR